MITYSIIQKLQLEGAKRIDAEYYQPEYFIDFSKGKWQLIGNVVKVCQYGISKSMNEEGVGYQIFRMNDIEDAFLSDKGIKYVDLPKNTFDQFRLEKNDILFNRVNSEEFVGRTGIFKLDGDYTFASYLVRLRAEEKNGILPDYLNMFLNSSFGIKQIKKFRRRAVNQANVNAEELKKIKIAILSLKNQKEIERLSNKSWKSFELSKSLYIQAESLLLERLGLRNLDKESGLSCVVNLSDMKSARRVDAEYFQPKYREMIERIKNKFNGVKLDESVDMKKGIEPGAEEYRKEGKQFIRVSSLSKNGISNDGQKYLSEDLYEELKENYEPKKGEILLTKDASLGIAYVLKKEVEGIISGGILRLKLKSKKVEDEYLALCLNSIVGKMQAERDAGGSVIAHWKPEQIKNVLIPILPKSVQQKITDLIRKSHESRKKSKQLLKEAKQKVEDIIEIKKVK